MTDAEKREWARRVMRTCPVCRRQAKHPRGDGCEKCLGEMDDVEDESLWAATQCP